MPHYSVLFKADLENVQLVAPEQPRRWGIKFQCTSCQSISEKFTYVEESETAERDGGEANQIVSCKFCRARVSMNVDPKSYGAYQGQPQPAPIVVLELRGAEPVELDIEDLWVITAAESGETFPNADLTEDWCDYDEKGAQSVCVSGVAIGFTRAK